MNRYQWSKIAIASLSPVAIVSYAYAVDYLSIPQAQRVLFPEAQDFRDHSLMLTAQQKKDIKSLSGRPQRQDKQQVWEAWKDGVFLGWFMKDDVIGKHEFITYATAISPDGIVLGVEIMSYRETHGAQVRNPEWREHFKGKSLKDPFRLDGDIPNISGATLSCRNITDGVKRLLALWKVALSQQS